MDNDFSPLLLLLRLCYWYASIFWRENHQWEKERERESKGIVRSLETIGYRQLVRGFARKRRDLFIFLIEEKSWSLQDERERERGRREICEHPLWHFSADLAACFLHNIFRIFFVEVSPFSLTYGNKQDNRWKLQRHSSSSIIVWFECTVGVLLSRHRSIERNVKQLCLFIISQCVRDLSNKEKNYFPSLALACAHKISLLT